MRERPNPNGAEPGLTDLLKRLGDDASALVRGEVALAKLEVGESVRAIVRDSGKLVGALTLAVLGALALTAALIIGIGHLLDGSFGWAALIVGVVFLAIGAVLARYGLRAFNGGDLMPTASLDSIAMSRDLVTREVRELTRELTGPEAEAERKVEAGMDSSAAAQRAIRERTLKP